jgi:phage RecT family recombinase
MSNQVTRIENYIESAMPEARRVSVIAERLEAEKNFAIQLLYKNQYSLDAANKNPTSVQNALINLSAIGISLNPALKHAYLVPRDGAICLDVSYMGLMHLAQETGSILWGQAKIVHENDTYENQGLDKEPIHKYSPFAERGAKVGVYCCVKLPTGDFLTEEMDLAQIEAIRQTSKAKDSKYSPWQTFESEMWRKSVVKRASKYWPKASDRLDTAINVLNEHEGLEDNSPERAQLVKKLHAYASDMHTPMELFGFIRSIKDESLNQWVCNQFQKGKKTAGKDKIGEGRNIFSEYIKIFNSGDDLAIAEAKQEMTDLELQMMPAIN